MQRRVGDKRVLALVKSYLKADLLTEDGTLADTSAGTPRGSILPRCSATWHCRSSTTSSPKLAGVALPADLNGPNGGVTVALVRINQIQRG